MQRHGPLHLMKPINSEAQLLTLVRNASIVGVTGYPGAGKTTLSKLLAKSGKTIIHTDPFIQGRAHENVPDAILESLPKSDYVVEGTQVVRLLKRGWQPDLIIWAYGSERHIKDPNYSAGIRSMLDSRIKTYDGEIYKINPRTIIPDLYPYPRVMRGNHWHTVE